MPNDRTSPTSALEQAAEYERDNPDVAEALRLFGMSAEEYDRTLAALNGVAAAYTASHTNTGDVPSA